MPLAPGHLLVTTRKHHEKISDVTEEEAEELGRWLPRLSRANARAGGVWDWNIVQNNGMFGFCHSFSLGGRGLRKTPGLGVGC
jgi:diadenosine tetraphosphate (Ap4A) HIT family hydrolase